MEENKLTLQKFEEASEIVKKVTLETKLVYSDFFISRLQPRLVRNGPWLNRNGTKVNIILKFQPTKKNFWKINENEKIFWRIFGKSFNKHCSAWPHSKYISTVPRETRILGF